MTTTTIVTRQSYRDCRQVLLHELAIRKHGAGEKRDKVCHAMRKGLVSLRHYYYSKA